LRRLPAATVFYGLEFALSMPAFVVTAVYFVREVHMSPLQLVLTGTVMEVAVFLFEVPTGALADTYGRRLSLIVAFAVQGAAIVVVGAVPEFWPIAAAWFLWGIGATFESGAYEAWIVDEVGPDRAGRVFLRGARLRYAGALVGLTASVAIALWSLQAAVIAGGILTLLCALGCAVVMPETGFVRRSREERPRPLGQLASTVRASAGFVRVQPLLLLIIAIAFFTGMSSEALDRLWEAHFIRDVGLPRVGSLDPIVWFGLFGAAVLLVGLLGASYLIRRFDDASSTQLARGLLSMTVVLMVAEIVFALAGTLALALCALLLARLMRSLARPLTMTWLNRQIDDSSVRATVISIAGQSDAIGEAAGGPGLGGIGNAFGIRAALVAGALVLAPALALYGRALRHGGREPELETLAVPSQP
jgi:MFS transporter, DHA3 family, tetracycline resistance protein